MAKATQDLKSIVMKLSTTKLTSTETVKVLQTLTDAFLSVRKAPIITDPEVREALSICAKALFKPLYEKHDPLVQRAAVVTIDTALCTDTSFFAGQPKYEAMMNQRMMFEIGVSDQAEDVMARASRVNFARYTAVLERIENADVGVALMGNAKYLFEEQASLLEHTPNKKRSERVEFARQRYVEYRRRVEDGLQQTFRASLSLL